MPTPHNTINAPLLTVEHLTVRIPHQGSYLPLLNDICFAVNPHETVALLGASGSGKSLTSLAILGLLPPGAECVSGNICFRGRPVFDAAGNYDHRLRGKHIAMIFQEGGAAFNPVFTIGYQICDVLRTHLGLTRQQAHSRTLALFSQVGLHEPQRVFDAYPHQLSGGMGQRCMIAMALSCRPELIIADEPTTSLDITRQVRILALLKSLQAKLRFSMIFISHDIQAVTAVADSVVVLQSGGVIESGVLAEITAAPVHEYTRRLTQARLPLQQMMAGAP